MERKEEKTTIYTFTVSEVLRALRLGIPKSKTVYFNEDINLENGEALLEIHVKDGVRRL